MAHLIYQPGEDDHPHVDADTCGKCRKPLGPGHRVTIAHIVERAGANPVNIKERGATLFEEYEIVHVNCHDPLLKRGLLV